MQIMQYKSCKQNHAIKKSNTNHANKTETQVLTFGFKYNHIDPKKTQKKTPTFCLAF